MTNHEWVALRLLDYGFEFKKFADVWPSLTERGLVERRDGRLRVTGIGRKAMWATAESHKSRVPGRS